MSGDGDDCNTNEDDCTQCFSTHTLSMRDALVQCELLYAHLSSNPKIHPQRRNSTKTTTSSPSSYRQESLEKFIGSGCVIPVVDVHDMEPSQFRRTFHEGNIPCVVRGLTQRYFGLVDKNWVLHWDDDKQQKKRFCCINRIWFRENVGDDTIVPIRIETDGNVDSDGRAEECDTRNVPLKQWLDRDEGTLIPTEYLKDWHLVKELQTNGGPITKAMYEVPAIFERDLLNRFLTRFTDGDYKFCYWGPAGSKTPLHSDVLHSFSWSYNVIGEKRWTFYPANVPDEVASNEIVVVQRAGEAVFVPATWKHNVENMVETLSINHNWITSSNIDLTWDCLQSEMKAITDEMEAWGVEAFDAKESMLRGCTGLDVTSFFFLALFSLLEDLLLTTSDDAERSQRKLGCMLDVLLQFPELIPRMEAVLECKVLTEKALQLARQVHDALKYQS